MINEVCNQRKPSVDKTTLVKKLASHIKTPKAGFYTKEILKNGTRVGFKVVTLDGRRQAVLAHVDIRSYYQVGKYKVDIKNFESMAEEVLRQAISHREEVVIIDEIGKMELFSSRFKENVLRVINLPNIVLIVLKPDWTKDWIRKIKNDREVLHFELTHSNFQEIFSQILKLIPKKTKETG